MTSFGIDYPDVKNPKKTAKLNFIMKDSMQLQALLDLFRSLR